MVMVFMNWPREPIPGCAPASAARLTRIRTPGRHSQHNAHLSARLTLSLADCTWFRANSIKREKMSRVTRSLVPFAPFEPTGSVLTAVTYCRRLQNYLLHQRVSTAAACAELSPPGGIDANLKGKPQGPTVRPKPAMTLDGFVAPSCTRSWVCPCRAVFHIGFRLVHRSALVSRAGEVDPGHMRVHATVDFVLLYTAPMLLMPCMRAMCSPFIKSFTGYFLTFWATSLFLLL